MFGYLEKKAYIAAVLTCHFNSYIVCTVSCQNNIH